MRSNLFSSVFGMVILTSAAQAAPVDPYRITANEKAACTGDAIMLCSDAYPDEHRLLACMASNRSSLSAGCGAVFDAGLRRRHLNTSAQK
ncbi:hypothetical protein RHAL1_02846 [Beijerinckiaceae bacterium RH AL1]|jgi:hypothetical protein|nr:hypothetical protein [Beijerinckiaceae bacterium]VVB47507.1 hypothetical protein RHCH11_RHCH11_02786 [Beijerinckiaceae bacterium RH CH11]VVB47588.1 hypothetical protein RHAL8_02782 [Beijerinckiaceae bacterium RH AL8]VVC55923.1 hypothetical protein RHAL1_02846 [Beijerinckiaceae bacterium RH AL1]